MPANSAEVERGELRKSRTDQFEDIAGKLGRPDGIFRRFDNERVEVRQNREVCVDEAGFVDVRTSFGYLDAECTHECTALRGEGEPR